MWLGSAASGGYTNATADDAGRKASDATGPDEHILAAASATCTVSLVDASALVSAAALNELGE
jgi:hypothetical protein